MRNLCLLLLLFLCSSVTLFAQIFSKTIDPDIVTTYTISGASKNFGDLGKNYIIYASKNKDGFFEITLQKDDTLKESEKIKPLTFDRFNKVFERMLRDLMREDLKDSTLTLAYSPSHINALFTELVVFERTENEKPYVADIELKEIIPVKFEYYVIFNDSIHTHCVEELQELQELKKARIIKKERAKRQEKELHKKIAKNMYLKTDYETLQDAHLEITFFNGYIEKIELTGTVLEQKMRFVNLFSIGIASESVVKKLATHQLESIEKYVVKKEGAKYEIVVEDKHLYESTNMSVNVADIIRYDPEKDINAHDISPEPTKIVLDKETRKKKLYRQETTKLFEGIIYSDLMGIFDNENPNGLIQMEVSKRILLNTERSSLYRCWWKFFPGGWYSDAVGWIEHIDVFGTLSKLEQNNKFLEPTIFMPDTEQESSYLSPLKILQHQAFSAGADLNLATFENQNKRIYTTLNFGLRYGGTFIKYPDENENLVNTIQPSVELKFQFIPERRYSFTVSNRISYFEILNDNKALPIFDLTKEGLVSPIYKYNKTSLLFTVSTATTGRFFLRYNLVSRLNGFGNSFSQLQFGYSFYILKRNGAIKSLLQD